MPGRNVLMACLVSALAACATPAPEPPPPPAEVVAPTPPPVPFSVAAGSNDTWNAVGQILVRTPGVHYEDRSQMLGLYSIRYRGAPMRILVRALPLSDAIRDRTTEVAVALPQAEPAANADASALMALLARELPAEVESVKARFAAEAAEQEARAKAQKKKKKPARK